MRRSRQAPKRVGIQEGYYQKDELDTAARGPSFGKNVYQDWWTRLLVGRPRIVLDDAQRDGGRGAGLGKGRSRSASAEHVAPLSQRFQGDSLSLQRRLDWCEASVLTGRREAEQAEMVVGRSKEAMAAKRHQAHQHSSDHLVPSAEQSMFPFTEGYLQIVDGGLSCLVTNATDTEMDFLHAKSALLLLDSRSLVEEWDSAYTLEATTWHKRYQRLIENLTSHLSVAKTPLLELSFIHPAQILTLKTCILMTLAALANLHSLSAPFQPSSRAQHAEAIDDMALISSSFVPEDYRYFEATISVAWAVALRSVSTGTFSPLEEVNEIDAEFDVDGLTGPSQRSLDIIRGCNATFSRWFPFVMEA
ncbi:hypothetical protein FB45DRAFT_1010478 [Roridomyces roridus]|uniref:Uncharacterized protein n=1 Tax=Roridomyces roridus TaxID=1738132 RepID=A0AAD7B3I9_9AGAR|nr:hypothetical protein FB45DRAFT_1010478 [Roridomyces roridus]